MKISELISKLEEIKKQEGDLNVFVTESHEYWGTLYNNIEDYSIVVSDHVQSEGPKSFKSERGVTFNY